MVEGEGFEPSKAEPTDLQSVPFDRSGTPPNFVTAETRDYSSLPVTPSTARRLCAEVAREIYLLNFNDLKTRQARRGGFGIILRRRAKLVKKDTHALLSR